MSEAHSPNNLLDTWPNRFFKARHRNIRWNRAMVKTVAQESGIEVIAPESESNGITNTESGSSARVTATQKEKAKHIEAIKGRFNAG